MTNVVLARSYLKKAVDRLDILEVLFQKGAYSDVVRKAQEIVELATKGMLRAVGIEPPKYHDVGSLILEHADRFVPISHEKLQQIAAISKRLRKERELSFYGDIDFIPTEEYKREDAKEAIDDAHFVVKIATSVIMTEK
ncbi:HEPN domain-containing protein [Atrimonas thermophila]|uniref:HEPN domain-containing protein n=1 Tax=Atrimonas thermophila TaxID=3064161 RepID=UPI00399D253D